MIEKSCLLEAIEYRSRTLNTIYEKFNEPLPGQNEIWVKFYHFGLKMMVKSTLEKNIYEISPCSNPFSDPLTYLAKRKENFSQSCKFSNKNDLVSPILHFERVR